MPRSMADPNYVYSPWSEERRAKLSLVHKARLGIPADCVQIYGVHVPAKRENPLRQYAAYVRQNRGLDAATAFVRKALDDARLRKPRRDRILIASTTYIYRPWPETVRKRIFKLARRVGVPVDGVPVYGIKVPLGYVGTIRPHARKAAYRAGREAARWVICEAWAKRWPELEAPVRRRIDLDLVRMLIAEHSTIEEVAEFLKVTPRYLKLQLKVSGDE